jgi:hypothetical protein
LGIPDTYQGNGKADWLEPSQARYRTTRFGFLFRDTPGEQSFEVNEPPSSAAVMTVTVHGSIAVEAAEGQLPGVKRAAPQPV